MYQSCCCAVKKQRREGRAYRHALSVRKGFKVAKSQGFKDPHAEPLSLPTGKPYNFYTATFATSKPCNFETLRSRVGWTIRLGTVVIAAILVLVTMQEVKLRQG